MAIKVNNTTVIDDSRALTNLTSVDTATLNVLNAAGIVATADSIETFSSEPAVSASGGIYYNTTTDKLYYSDGSSWLSLTNSPPVWNSPAEGSTTGGAVGQAFSLSLSATDPEGQAISFSSSSLPAGLSISGGAITGTPTAEGTSSVEVSASDGRDSITRSFFINVIDPPLFSFSSFTFYSDVFGYDGPTSAPTGYSSQAFFANHFTLSQGVQQWTVPEDGLYDFRLFGASGGGGMGVSYPSVQAGNGAQVEGRLTLTKGQVLNLVVGQVTQSSVANSGGGGGGGSWVYTGSIGGGGLLFCAGGGGGWGHDNGSGAPASVTTSPNNSVGGSGTGPTANTGYGGNAGSTTAYGSGSGGAGWLGDGVAGSYSTTGGKRWQGGRRDDQAYGNPWQGGFGGGAAGSGNGAAGGGGGGYTGGSGGNGYVSGAMWGGGGGGGSYITSAATNTSLSSRGTFNSGNLQATTTPSTGQPSNGSIRITAVT